MDKRDQAEKIYNALNKRGAGLGNASVPIIEDALIELNENLRTRLELAEAVIEAAKPFVSQTEIDDIGEDEETFLFDYFNSLSKEDFIKLLNAVEAYKAEK